MQKIPCSHCQQEYPKDMLSSYKQDDKILYFCCNGCKLAYELLKENNLESFYDKLGHNVLQTKIMQDSKSVMNYNSINFQQKYLKDRGEYKEVYFIIEGIVCAACVWLNEQILASMQGIQDIKINYTSHKAKILFDDKIITFAQIAQTIQKLGYDIVVYDPKDKESKDSKRNSLYYIKLVVAIFCTMNVMWVNVGQYSGFFFGIDSTSSDILNLASFILTTPVLFFCASDFYIHALKGLKNKIVGMELLVITGSSLVYCYSIYAWLTQSGHTYFESICMIILFVLSAKFLESLSRKKSNDNLDKLNSILPLEARRENGEIISVYDIKQDDILLVLPGEMLACDGILQSEFANLDYSNISGESMSMEKYINQEVMAGSIALHKPLLYKVKKVFEDSSMSKLANLLKESEFSTPKIASFAFKIAGYFSKVVLSIAILGFCYYYFMAGSGFEKALLIAVSVIVIACPCALALATPIASVVGLNMAFKNRIIFTKANFLESLAKANLVVFDKTGTLTQGKMQVVKILCFATNLFHSSLDSLSDKESKNCKGGVILHNDSMQDLKPCNAQSHQANLYPLYNIPLQDLSLLWHIMIHNPHPVAKSIMQYIEEMLQNQNSQLLDYEIMDFKLIEGRGFYAKTQSLEILGGSQTFMQEQGVILHDVPLISPQDIIYANTHFYIATKPLHSLSDKDSTQIPYTLTYIFYLQDSLKPFAKSLIRNLQDMKKEIVIMSGDKQEVLDDIAKELNITHYYANFTPLQKANTIQSWIQQGKNIAMIGDGLNDSLALKYAQVGIAMGSGSEIAIAQSDIIILDDDLGTLNNAFIIAHKTLQHIKENLLLSLIYNAIAIPFALCGFVIPLFAAAFMSLSSISVVLNSLRIYKASLHKS